MNTAATAKSTPKLAQEAVVKNFFAELGLDGVEDPLEKARRMYAQLAGVKRFKKTKEQSQDLASSIHVVLNDGGGHCITLSNAFIALCRLQGIAARQVTGALAGYPAGDGRFEIAAYNEILFGHTWVEIFAPGQGWVPVEFSRYCHWPAGGDGRQCRRRCAAPPYRRSRRSLRRFLLWPVGLSPRRVFQFGQDHTATVDLARNRGRAAILRAGGLKVRVPASSLSASEMDISVVIATHNQKERLRLGTGWDCAARPRRRCGLKSWSWTTAVATGRTQCSTRLVARWTLKVVRLRPKRRALPGAQSGELRPQRENSSPSWTGTPCLIHSGSNAT